jgi:hypothetical protein
MEWNGIGQSIGCSPYRYIISGEIKIVIDTMEALVDMSGID